jgi:uncharacterized protein
MSGLTSLRLRRWFFVLLATTILSFVGAWLAWPLAVDSLGGAWEEIDGAWEEQLSPGARSVLAEALEGLERGRLVDVHVHLAGLGTGNSGCRVNPEMQSWWHPLKRVRLDMYLSASGVLDLERADEEYVERLLGLAKSAPLDERFCVLAFDQHYRENGEVDPHRTEFYVPNEYVWEVTRRDPRHLIPAISVHPYRKDALEELEKWGERGVRWLKWLPNAMGIDPASPRCDAFYEKLVELDITLLTHTGKELAVDAAEFQELGNPLRLRRALDAGVRVVAAHCATLGTNLDLDDPERAETSSFELFLRLMEEERYVGLLWGDLSAVALVNRGTEPIRVLLERTDLHPRLVNGSDYPIPAINALIHLGPLVEAEFLTEERAEGLREIYRLHPLAFDLALKRLLRSPATGRGFPAACFGAPAIFGL